MQLKEVQVGLPTVIGKLHQGPPNMSPSFWMESRQRRPVSLRTASKCVFGHTLYRHTIHQARHPLSFAKAPYPNKSPSLPPAPYSFPHMLS